MGLGMLDDFDLIMPIKIIATARKTFSHGMKLLDLETKNEVTEGEQEVCQTPTSPSQILKIPLVCPPPPKKPHVARRSDDVTAPSQGFIQMSHDLASIFVCFFPKPSGGGWVFLQGCWQRATGHHGQPSSAYPLPTC
ncbi:unnamed protein product [Lupinus luteus]|uniref:Uncharacterized protein n=1 Tax=Lupinus luteus TaxID=3873 RepID=A0AAV1XNW0_LUPLU